MGLKVMSSDVSTHKKNLTWENLSSLPFSKSIMSLSHGRRGGGESQVGKGCGVSRGIIATLEWDCYMGTNAWEELEWRGSQCKDYGEKEGISVFNFPAPKFRGVESWGLI